jgi:hypothetical protein
LVHRATACISAEASPLPSRITATGFPLNGTAVKTSTCWNGRVIMAFTSLDV